MECQLKKVKGSLSEITNSQPPLTLQELINYQKFLLMTTQKTISQSKKYNLIMDRMIEELESSLSASEQQNQGLLNILKANDLELKNMSSEKNSEECLLEYLGPKMEILQKNTFHAVQKKEEYEQSCKKLKEIRAQYQKEENYFRASESNLKRKDEKVKRLKNEIEWQEKQIQRLCKLLLQYNTQNAEMFTLKKKLNNQLQQRKGNIRVYCRVRPCKKQESIISVTSDNTLQFTYERQKVRGDHEKCEQGYSFDQVFKPNQNQQSIFTELSQLVQSSIDGKNVCIFAYGQTGSGKTYTLLGPEEEGKTKQQIYEERGLAPRSIELIFKQIQVSKKYNWNFEAKLSIQEIYLENIIDLINKSQTSIDSCTEVLVTEADEVLAFMKEAALNRKKAATNVNQRSSRSHLVITLKLSGKGEKIEDQRKGSIVFIDLAGCERLKQSKAEGDTLKQTQFINKSLSALSNVINEMRKTSEHIPFRNSKLTYVLKPYLQGDSKTLMFVNISPDRQDLNQTKISLNFAEGVREVKKK